MKQIPQLSVLPRLFVLPQLSVWIAAAALVACTPVDARTAPLSEAAEWLQTYLQIDTTNPPGNEGESAQFLADILHREGIATERLVSPGGRTSLYARLRADRSSADHSLETSDPGAVVLLHHMDVVPATEDWEHPPFSGTLDDGKLWGRGAIDTKGLGVAHLAAFIDLHRRGVSLSRDVIFLAVADEERGGTEGTKWILERHADLLGEIYVVLNEGGNNPQGSDGRTLWAGIEVAQKRPLWLEVTTRGRGGHASGYRPTSASHRLIQALDNLLELEIPFRTTAALDLYLRSLAPMQSEQRREVFLNFSDYLEPSGPTVQLAPWIYPLLLDTVQVTVLSASDSINSTARNASALVDVRLLPDTDADQFLARVREAMGDRIDVEVLLVAPPSEPSPVDHPAFHAFEQVLGDGRPVIPTFLAGITDSRFFRERSIPAYGVFPFFLAAPDLMGIHGRNERMPLAEFDEGIVRMIRIVEAIAAAPTV